MIKLTVGKETFCKYLVDLGFNYNIVNYDNFIDSIQKRTKKRLLDSLSENHFEDTVSFVYGNIKNTDILSLSKSNLITKIRKDYFLSILNSGVLDNYITERKKISYSKEIQEYAYILKRLKNIKFKNYRIKSLFNYFLKLNKSDSKRLTATKCINDDEIDLSISEIKEIDDFLISKFKLTVTKSILGDVEEVLEKMKFLEFNKTKFIIKEELTSLIDKYNITNVSQIEGINSFRILENENLNNDYYYLKKIIETTKYYTLFNNSTSLAMIYSIITDDMSDVKYMLPMQREQLWNTWQSFSHINHISELESKIGKELDEYNPLSINHYNLDISFNDDIKNIRAFEIREVE